VAKGDAVAAGTTIGLAGSTGLSTGPHVHWDAVAQGTFFDPQVLLDGALHAD
jgi:murein DD-endopeptidase MepM/ murein hydrolase activator NlpD